MTLRALLRMVEARREEEWDRASFIAAAALNATPGRRRAISPHTINPYTAWKRRSPVLVTNRVDDLADIVPWEE